MFELIIYFRSFVFQLEHSRSYFDLKNIAALSFQEIVRKEEERMRAQSRREAQQRRNRMRPSLGRSGLTANFLEDRDEDSGTCFFCYLSLIYWT